MVNVLSAFQHIRAAGGMPGEVEGPQGDGIWCQEAEKWRFTKQIISHYIICTYI